MLLGESLNESGPVERRKAGSKPERLIASSMAWSALGRSSTLPAFRPLSFGV